ncbi:MAG: fatty acid kinase fatty acid binding subunit [Thermoleophilaceae bacterium]|jgi:DegV family protein with EDD domain|nr:fatty acid kinase fatty acid binding subunit [Thermoleophilaceae bacterium]
MPRATVVTDTTAYLPTEVAEANGIRLVSLYVNFGGQRTEREADIGDYAAFYEELRSAEQLPTTSQPSVGDFVAVYEPLLADGGEVVSIHISGGISGSVGSAQQAKETLERDGKGGERVHVMDSRTAAGGLGLVVVAAARRATAGDGAEAVVEAAASAREQLKMWFAIDTLEFLRRSGRVGAASAWIGSTLKVKPILSVESEITPVERVRTSKRAFERMVDYAKLRQVSGADGWVVQHIQAQEQADRLADRCREVFDCEAVFCSEIGPVLGCHTGPGLLGVGSIPTRFLA